MRFAYRCGGDHEAIGTFPIGEAPSVLGDCGACGAPLRRYFGPDTLPQFGVDPFRSFHLSAHREHVQAEQQRRVDAPADRVDARALERAQGIKFVGNDTDGMTKPARRAIETYKERKRDGQQV